MPSGERASIQAAGGAVLGAQAGLGDRRLALVAQARHRAADPRGDELVDEALVGRGRARALERELERADRAEPVLDGELEPLGGGGPRGIARRGAVAAPAVEPQRRGAHAEVPAQALDQVLEHLVRRQGVDGGVEHRPQPREQLLRAEAIRAGGSSPLHCAGGY
jgi:hypothetical protein